MAVEILILSGARQGDRLVLDARQFQVGSDPACDVCFDPQRDRGIQGRSAVFRLQDDGWHVRGAGGEVLVNQRPVAGWMRLRSGDLVRMSQSGPDFSFGIVTAATATPTKPSPAPHATPASNAPGWASPAKPAAMPDAASTPPPVFAATNSPTAEPKPTPAALAPLQPRADRPWAVWVGIGLAVCLMGVLLLRPTVIVVPSDHPIVPAAPPDTPAVAPVVPTVPPVAPAPPIADQEKKPPDEKAAPLDLPAQLNDALFLTQVETAGRTWPFATCVAISGNTLLTTAREAAQLAAWRAEKGFKIWVTRQATGFKEEVQEIRVHGLYASLPEKSDDWIYVDLALLTVAGKLPKWAPMALPQDLAELKEGLPVFCFGFNPEGGKVTDFDKFEPHLTPGKVFVINVSQELPSKARALGVTAEIPKNAFGSPIVDAKGRIIGIYGKPFTPPEGQGSPAGAPAFKNLHFAPVVIADLINNGKMWVTAAAAPTAQRPQDKR